MVRVSPGTRLWHLLDGLELESENRITPRKDLEHCRRAFLPAEALILAIYHPEMAISPRCMGFIPNFCSEMRPVLPLSLRMIERRPEMREGPKFM